MTSNERETRQEITRKHIDGYEEIIDGKKIIYPPEIIASFPKKSNKPKDERTADEEADDLLHTLMTEFSVHTCSHACKDTDGTKCKKGFEDFIVQAISSFSNRNKPLYARKTVEDLKVVSINPAMLYDWQAHMNVESATNEMCVAYLYDYLFKGLKKILAEARKRQKEAGEENPELGTISSIYTYLLTYLLIYLLTYLLTFLTSG